MYHERAQGRHLTRRHRRPDHIPDPRGRPVIIGVKNHIDINRTSGRHPQGVSVITEIDPIGTHQRHRSGFYDGLVVGEVCAPVARDLDWRLDAGADCVDCDLFTGLRGPAVYSCGLVDPAPGAPAGSDPLNVGAADLDTYSPARLMLRGQLDPEVLKLIPLRSVSLKMRMSPVPLSRRQTLDPDRTLASGKLSGSRCVLAAFHAHFTLAGC